MQFSEFIHGLIAHGPFLFFLILGPFLLIKTDIPDKLADKIDALWNHEKDWGATILLVVWVILMGWAYLWGHDLAEAYWFIKIGQYVPGTPYPY